MLVFFVVVGEVLRTDVLLLPPLLPDLLLDPLDFLEDELEEPLELPPLLHCFMVTITSALVHFPPWVMVGSFTVASVSMSLHETSFLLPT